MAVAARLFEQGDPTDAGELERRLVAIQDTAIENGKYRAGKLTEKSKAEYQRLYPLWLRARA